VLIVVKGGSNYVCFCFVLNERVIILFPCFFQKNVFDMLLVYCQVKAYICPFLVLNNFIVVVI
jgi:hypothetical protein